MNKLIYCLFPLLTSCANPLTSPVIEPDKRCLTDTTLSQCYNAMDGLNSFKDVALAYRAYATAWSNEADKKKQQALVADEFTFYGLVTSLIGIATKSPETIIAGASVGAMGTIYNKRYALDIQSKNYDLASEAVECMYISVSPYMNDTEYNTEELRDKSIESLIKIRRVLKNLQYNLKLGTPNIDMLFAALKDKAFTSIESSGNKAKQFGKSVIISEKTKTVQAIMAELKICEAKIND